MSKDKNLEILEHPEYKTAKAILVDTLYENGAGLLSGTMQPIVRAMIKFKENYPGKLEAENKRLLRLIQKAYLTGRADEKGNVRGPYIKITVGWQGFIEQNNITELVAVKNPESLGGEAPAATNK